MKKRNNQLLPIQIFIAFIVCILAFIAGAVIQKNRAYTLSVFQIRGSTLTSLFYPLELLSLAVFSASLIAIWCKGLSRLEYVFKFEYNARYQRLSQECVWMFSLSILPVVSFFITFGFLSIFMLREYAFLLSLISFWIISGNFIYKAINDSWERELPVLRGTELSRFHEAKSKSLKLTAKDSLKIFWGGLNLPWYEAAYNFLVCGSIGSGKTTHILLHMLSTLTHFGEGLKQRAFVYSWKRDIISFLTWLEPECPIYVLDPYDYRFVGWEIAKDIGNDPEEVRELAESIIPADDKTGEPYFRDTAVLIVDAIIQGLIIRSPKTWTFRDLILITRNEKTITEFLISIPEKRHVIEQHAKEIGKTFQCVISTAVGKLSRLESVAAAMERAEEKISLRELLENDEEFIVVLHGHPIKNSSCATFNRLVLTFAGMVALSLQETKTSTDIKYRRTWFYLDEAHTLGKLNILPTLASLLRGFGGCLVLGFQDIAQFDEIYGTYKRRSIINNITHKTYLRNEEVETQEWCSKQLGSQDRIETSFSQNSSFHSNSWGNNQAVQNRMVVLPSEFGEIPRASREDGILGFAKNRLGSYEVFLEPNLLKSLPDDDPDLNLQEYRAKNIKEWYVTPLSEEREKLLYAKDEETIEDNLEVQGIKQVAKKFSKRSREIDTYEQFIEL